MDSIELYAVALVIVGFWVSIYILSKVFNFKRFNLELKPFYLLWKTERLNKLLGKIAQASPRLWRILGSVGVAMGVGLQIYALYFISRNLLSFIFDPQSASPLVPIVPGITISLYWVPYLLVGLAINLAVHELAHGISAQAEGIPIKSSGLFFFILFPGGFVEPDEDVLSKSKMISKLRVLAAGSSSNLMIGVIVFLLTMSMYAPPSGILITGVVQGGGAEKAGIMAGDIIYSINGNVTKDIGALYYYINGVKPGQVLVLDTDRGPVPLTTSQDPANSSRAFMGIQRDNYLPSALDVFGHIVSYGAFNSLNWTFIVALSVAILNMLPVYYLDGDGFLSSALEKYVPRKKEKIRSAISMLFLAILVLNIGLSLLKLYL
jgi:membrane-associated protease RseP (regulator of RpoE activity)